MNKSSFERKLKETAESKALEDLNKVKSGHSKVKDLKHTKLQMRNYFLPNGLFHVNVNLFNIRFVYLDTHAVSCTALKDVKANNF